MPVYNKRGILLLPKVIVLNPKDGFRENIVPSIREEKQHYLSISIDNLKGLQIESSFHEYGNQKMS